MSFLGGLVDFTCEKVGQGPILHRVSDMEALKIMTPTERQG